MNGTSPCIRLLASLLPASWPSRAEILATAARVDAAHRGDGSGVLLRAWATWRRRGELPADANVRDLLAALGLLLGGIERDAVPSPTPPPDRGRTMLTDPEELRHDRRADAARPQRRTTTEDDAAAAPSQAKAETDALLAKLRDGDAAGRNRRWLSIVRSDRRPTTVPALEAAIREVAELDQVDAAVVASGIDTILQKAHGTSLATWRENLATRARRLPAALTADPKAPRATGTATTPTQRQPGALPGSTGQLNRTPQAGRLLPFPISRAQ